MQGVIPPTPLQNWHKAFDAASNSPSKLAHDLLADLQLPFKTGFSLTIPLYYMEKSMI